jgi:hypothetical protein
MLHLLRGIYIKRTHLDIAHPGRIERNAACLVQTINAPGEDQLSIPRALR